MPPPVSIVVPVYNAERTVRKTLQSLADQTYLNLQVIVVDDGSKDSSLSIINEFDFEYIAQANAGQSAALNNGWRSASGKYLGYLSADDVLYPEAIELLVAHLERNESAAVVYPDYDLIDEAGETLRRVILPEFSQTELVEEVTLRMGPGALFRREIFEQTGGWRTDLRINADLDFWLRASSLGRLQRVPQCLTGWRVHPASQSVAPVSVAASDEPIIVMKHFCDNNPEWRRDRVLAKATLFSARYHIRSGRFKTGLRRVATALATEPRIALSMSSWRILAGGLKAYFSTIAKGSARTIVRA